MVGLGSLFGQGGGLPHFSIIAIGALELAWGIPLALLGAAAGWLFHGSGRIVRGLASRLGDRPVAKAVAAGAFLGAAGVVLPFTMFAGEAQTEQLAARGPRSARRPHGHGIPEGDRHPGLPGPGWRGGHFFPIIFAGIAIGYGVAALTGVDPSSPCAPPLPA